MVGILIKVVIGALLFVGSLVGGLAATGRLNHEGTANIPVLGGFFPEPEQPVEGEGGADDATHGESQGGDAHEADSAAGEHGGPAEASLAGQDPQKPLRRKVGKSVVEPEEPKSDGHGGGHGGGHGEDEAGHGDDAAHGAAGDHATGDHAPSAAHGGGADHGAGGHDPRRGRNGDDRDPAERDFDELADLLQSQGRTSYQPGAYFTFRGMPAGLTADQLNDAWQRVEGIMRTIQQREDALDLRQKELRELADDIGRRWKDLGKRQLEIEAMQRALDGRIAEFQRTVRLVRDDEVQKLKRNATTLAAFERDKAAELFEAAWQTHAGQDEMLRMLEFMEVDAVNEILGLLPNAMVQDVLEKRMTVSKEAKASNGRD